MCYEVKCSICGKTGWEGCGKHVVSVYNRIPDGHHCQCKAWPGVHPNAAAVTAAPARAVEEVVGPRKSCTIL